MERGFIRVDADEMTYPGACHPARSGWKQALIAGDLSVDDLPGAWNEGFHALLGITPPDDARGCLQDIHWYDGAFGYFPSYTLGAMAAAQLMAAARRARARAGRGAGRGRHLPPCLAGCAPRCTAVGSLLGFNDLLRRGHRQAARPGRFHAHLTARYLA